MDDLNEVLSEANENSSSNSANSQSEEVTTESIETVSNVGESNELASDEESTETSEVSQEEIAAESNENTELLSTAGESSSIEESGISNSTVENGNQTQEAIPEVSSVEKVTMTTTETVLAVVEVRKSNQEVVVKSKSTNIESLENEIEVTRKKKKRRVLEAELQQSQNELALENQKLILIKQQPNEIISSQDELIKDPLHVRPSKAKYYESAVLSNEISSLENDLEDLNVQLEETRRKKKKRVVEAEILNVQNKLALAKMKREIAHQTAEEMVEVEVSTLKRLTNYGTEELVKLPEPSRELTTEEVDQLKTEIEYIQYVQARRDFDKVIESANVFYQSGAEKTAEAKSLEQEISLLNEGMELLPLEEQDSLRMLIVEKKTIQKKLMMEAEVYYQGGKELTNDAYYNLNEANSALLVLDDANKRSMIISAWTGYLKPEIVEVDTTRYDSINIDEIPANLATDIFVDSDVTFYSEEKPIPVDVKLPSGLILKVQIGAFRNPIPQETFKGFAPIVGERTNSGLTRYTAGLFKDFETANTAKNGIRAKGYSDAFVVAYLNGERISISEARRILSGDLAMEDANTTNSGSNQQGGNTSNDVSIAIKTVNSTVINDGQRVEVFEVANRGVLYFTVQVGVYSSRIDPTTVLNISPLNFEEIPNNLVRFSSGVYGSLNDAINAKNNIVRTQVSDAFVTAYHKGRRITIAEAKNIANGNVTNAPSGNVGQNNAAQESKTYYVSVGPYAGSIPIDQARVILTLNSVGVIVEKNNNATLYKIGNFTTRSEAEAMKTGLESKGLVKPTIVEVEK